MKRFDLERYGKTYSIQLTIATYLNGNLAIRMENWSNGEPELWNILTVNLGGKMPKDCAFIDTNNNGKDILAWIVRHGLPFQLDDLPPVDSAVIPNIGSVLPN